MVPVSSCVICESQIRIIGRALVAPFLAKRIWDREPFCVDLVSCLRCGFAFYNPRLDDAEEMRLYQSYRLDEYQKLRQWFEPWYTPKFNSDLASSSSYDRRRLLIAPILAKHTAGRKIKRVLDYGGDRGDLVRGLIDGADAFVYDISGVQPAPGITSVRDPGECTADLIINSNVLEHVGFPRSVVQQIVRAAPPGGLVFLEVPRERPKSFPRLLRRLAQIGIMSLAHPSIAPSLLRPAALYMMHEHINYFTVRSLEALMKSCGGQVVASGGYDYTGRAGSGELIWCLGSIATRSVEKVVGSSR